MARWEVRNDRPKAKELIITFKKPDDAAHCYQSDQIYYDCCVYDDNPEDPFLYVSYMEGEDLIIKAFSKDAIHSYKGVFKNE